jgi:hypothetical protein
LLPHLGVSQQSNRVGHDFLFAGVLPLRNRL